ncbi:hypothetical protein BC332_06837 [Capsicum chinense]|nr:hypothetical protein BC332_06837 [Capsicum chinense]
MDKITVLSKEAKIGTVWDEKGNDRVAGIYVWYDQYKVKALQFLFYDCGGRIFKSKVRGVYFSEKLKFTVKLGYTVLSIKGYLFEKGSSQKFFLEVKGEGALVLMQGTVECRYHEREVQDTRPRNPGNHSPMCQSLAHPGPRRPTQLERPSLI